MKDLVLYYQSYCPYCRKVMRYMEKNGIELQMRNIMEDRDAYETLVRVGGMNQVPCLFIDGKPLYESDDIIEYLGTAFGKKA